MADEVRYRKWSEIKAEMDAMSTEEHQARIQAARDALAARVEARREWARAAVARITAGD